MNLQFRMNMPHTALSGVTLLNPVTENDKAWKTEKEYYTYLIHTERLIMSKCLRPSYVLSEDTNSYRLTVIAVLSLCYSITSR